MNDDRNLDAIKDRATTDAIAQALSTIDSTLEYCAVFVESNIEYFVDPKDKRLAGTIAQALRNRKVSNG
ncbi:MAG: hypothetical protein KME42_13920 [Tildeniella nuda ZEHNDER 1965/U140]|jgi:hypothetical protein|nr:hypothetical protein [Tildeniella nuda ZEHNDER 1965/U140]